MKENENRHCLSPGMLIIYVTRYNKQSQITAPAQYNCISPIFGSMREIQPPIFGSGLSFIDHVSKHHFVANRVFWSAMRKAIEAHISGYVFCRISSVRRRSGHGMPRLTSLAGARPALTPGQNVANSARIRRDG